MAVILYNKLLCIYTQGFNTTILSMIGKHVMHYLHIINKGIASYMLEMSHSLLNVQLYLFQ